MSWCGRAARSGAWRRRPAIGRCRRATPCRSAFHAIATARGASPRRGKPAGTPRTAARKAEAEARRAAEEAKRIADAEARRLAAEEARRVAAEKARLAKEEVERIRQERERAAEEAKRAEEEAARAAAAQALQDAADAAATLARQIEEHKALTAEPDREPATIALPTVDASDEAATPQSGRKGKPRKARKKKSAAEPVPPAI